MKYIQPIIMFVLDYESAVICVIDGEPKYRYTIESLKSVVNMIEKANIALYTTAERKEEALETLGRLGMNRIFVDRIPKKHATNTNVFVSNGGFRYGDMTHVSAGAFYKDPTKGFPIPAIGRRLYTEAIMLVGIPFSGKSKFARERFPSYPVAKSVNDVRIRVAIGGSMVIDALNVSEQSRKAVIDELGGMPVRCIVIDTSYIQALKNMRTLCDTTKRNPNIPQLRQSISRFTQPRLDEGFSSITRVPFSTKIYEAECEKSVFGKIKPCDVW